MGQDSSESTLSVKLILSSFLSRISSTTYTGTWIGAGTFSEGTDVTVTLMSFQDFYSRNTT